MFIVGIVVGALARWIMPGSYNMGIVMTGVLGAFAFTLSVPLILVGNGLGALAVRQLTIGNIERVKKYVYLKNGAMYSVLVLGVVMLLHAFHFPVPEWVSPVATFAVIGYFFLKSVRAANQTGPPGRP